MQQISSCRQCCRPRNQLLLVVTFCFLTVIVFYLGNDSLTYKFAIMVYDVANRPPATTPATAILKESQRPSTVEASSTSTTSSSTSTPQSTSTSTSTSAWPSTTTRRPVLDEVFSLSALPRLHGAHEYGSGSGSGSGSEVSKSAKLGHSAKLCAYPPPDLKGAFEPNKTIPTSMEEIEARFGEVKLGGAWQPANCMPRWRIAIVVPFRNRDAHLRVFLSVYHEFLQRQQIAYRIFVVDQNDTEAFNRALLFNIGVYELLRTTEPNFSLSHLTQLTNMFMADQLSWKDSFVNVTASDLPWSKTVLKAASLFNITDRMNSSLQTEYDVRKLMNRFLGSAECVVFHDVDLLPEDDRNVYSCPALDPRHLSVGVDKFKYELLYPALFGGATSIQLSQFLKINGFSNVFFDWGGEDDDFAFRVQRYWSIARFPKEVARYTMLSGKEHTSAKQNPKRWQLLKESRGRFATDGINTLDGRYSLVERREEALYTYVGVRLVAPPVEPSPAARPAFSIYVVTMCVCVVHAVRSITDRIFVTQ